MAWITPKTDWNSSDFINYTDYNRIINNLNYVRTQAAKLGFNYPDWTSMIAAIGYASLTHADDWNKIVHNYNYFQNIFSDFEPLIKDDYVANGRTINYEELNIIESGTLLIKDVVDGTLDGMPRLAFTLGGTVFNMPLGDLSLTRNEKLSIRLGGNKIKL